jgi:hypothetical protein
VGSEHCIRVAPSRAVRSGSITASPQVCQARLRRSDTNTHYVVVQLQSYHYILSESLTSGSARISSCGCRPWIGDLPKFPTFCCS